MVFPGISVMLEGTLKVDATDANGFFEIKDLTPGSYHLDISGISYAKQVQKISLKPGQKLKVAILLEEDTRQLKEVISLKLKT